MKLNHVFGLVVAVHAAVFVAFFSTPGCRSAGKSKPRPEDTDPARSANVVAPVDSIDGTPVASMSYDDINASAPSDNYGDAQPVTRVTPEATGGEPAPVGVVRFTPARPVGTTAPLASASAPVAASATHTVVRGDNLWNLARQYGISIGELAAANNLSSSATLRIGQTLTVPATAVTSTDSPAAGFSNAANTYTVVAGDTLGAIARRHGTSVSALRTANNLRGDNLRVGQKLVLPADASPTGVSPVASTTGAASRPAAGAYTVVAGDTLGEIARRHGVKVGDLALLNNITDPAKLRVGQVLKIPAGATAAATPVTQTSVRPAAPAPDASAPAPAPAAPAPDFPVIPVDEPGAVSRTELEPAAVPVMRID